MHSLLSSFKKDKTKEIAESISKNFYVPYNEAIDKCSVLITGLYIHILHILIIEEMEYGTLIAKKFLDNTGKSKNDIEFIHKSFGKLRPTTERFFKKELEHYLGIPRNDLLSHWYYLKIRTSCETIIEVVKKETDKIELQDGIFVYSDSAEEVYKELNLKKTEDYKTERQCENKEAIRKGQNINDVGSLKMTENSNLTFRDLTLKEAWKLIKIFFSCVFACALVFVLPYVLLTSASKSVDTTFGQRTISEWVGYLCIYAVLLLVVFNIDEFFSSLAKFFADLANLTKAMSKIKRIAFAFLLFLYLYCCFHFTRITLLISVLVLLPAEFTYYQYKSILKEKLFTQEDV